MIEVTYLKSTDDRFHRKGNCAYFFKDEASGAIYKWSTSYNNHYGIFEGKKYLLTFSQTEEREDNAIRISNVKIHETLMNGDIIQKTNRKGTYKEWM